MSIRESNPQDECRTSVAVAAAVHQVLETLPALHLHTPVLSSALSALSGLHEDVMVSYIVLITCHYFYTSLLTLLFIPVFLNFSSLCAYFYLILLKLLNSLMHNLQ